MTENIFVMIDL